MFIRKRRSVPELNTASLPDLIFTVLFFFIIVTHMRQDEVKVRYRVPEGRQLTKMKKKSGVTHVYIGKPVDGRQEGYRIQVDNKVVTIDQLVDYLAESRSGMSPDEAQEMTVALSADKDVDMKTVMEVKQAQARRGDHEQHGVDVIGRGEIAVVCLADEAVERDFEEHADDLDDHRRQRQHRRTGQEILLLRCLFFQHSSVLSVGISCALLQKYAA